MVTNNHRRFLYSLYFHCSETNLKSFCHLQTSATEAQPGKIWEKQGFNMTMFPFNRRVLCQRCRTVRIKCIQIKDVWRPWGYRPRQLMYFVSKVYSRTTDQLAVYIMGYSRVRSAGGSPQLKWLCLHLGSTWGLKPDEVVATSCANNDNIFICWTVCLHF